MIRAAEDDLGPALDLETMEWEEASSSRRLDQGPSDTPSVVPVLGQPLGWWGPDRPGGGPGDEWTVLRFAVSYRIDRGWQVEWARLSVDLSGGDGNPPGIASDQYPENESEEEKRDIHLTISPQLKLSQVSASLGEASTTISIDRVIPIVSAWGGQESSFGWDLSSTDQHPISGVRHFFAVVPGSPRPRQVALRLEADVRSPNGFMRQGKPSKASRERQVEVLMQTW